jgi:cobalt-zinc-cadmium efflux system outer membrane protein
VSGRERHSVSSLYLSIVVVEALEAPSVPRRGDLCDRRIGLMTVRKAWCGLVQALLLVGLLLSSAVGAYGQSPADSDDANPVPSGDPSQEFTPGSSLLGQSPGMMSGTPLRAPYSPISGRAGAGVSRVPSSVSEPADWYTPPPPVAITPPPTLAPSELPNFGFLDLPNSPDTEGPPGAMTLDQAIELLVRRNLDLRAAAFEIPQAQADILTASLRANPVFYADVQQVPYGNFSNARPGGQTQYDVNISIPLDLSGKRQARMTVAGRAQQTLQAQYQNAVRLQIDNLYTAFVDMLAARETVRFGTASVEGLDAMLVPLQQRATQRLITQADVNRVRIQRDSARIALDNARQSVERSRQTLAQLLNYPDAEAQSLDVRGRIIEANALPIRGADLIAFGMQNRADLRAFVIGIERARAEVRLAQANRWSDVYWMVQPYTFQNNEPFGTKSAHSWATGVTVPMPIANRNQGNIRRAQLNVNQTCTERAAIERQIATEIRQAELEYEVTRRSVVQIESEMLPAATQVLRTSRMQLDRGEIDTTAWLAARQDYNDVVRQYRDMMVRHRRAALTINTAVGARLLP